MESQNTAERPTEPREGGAPSPDELSPEHEPVFTGTLFLTLILLMMIFGFWVLMYIELINR